MFLTVLNTTAFTVDLEWEEPLLTNGIIRNYTVLYFEASTGSPSATLYSYSTTETSIRISSLEPFTDYTFRVSAVTVAEGPFTEINATTKESGIYMYIHKQYNLHTYIHTYMYNVYR